MWCHAGPLVLAVIVFLITCCLQFIMFVSEFLLQVALYDPLLSLSSQLHCSSARRRTHTGERSQTDARFIKLLTDQRVKFTTIPFSVCPPGYSDSGCHEVWQGPDSREASRQAYQQRSVRLRVWRCWWNFDYFTLFFLNKAPGWLCVCVCFQVAVRLKSSCSFPWNCAQTCHPPTVSHHPKFQVAFNLFFFFFICSLTSSSALLH